MCISKEGAAARRGSLPARLLVPGLPAPLTLPPSCPYSPILLGTPFILSGAIPVE
jgi:hypothetical protein